MSIDYNRIAEFYDRHRKAGEVYMRSLDRLAKSCGTERALELGAGTGNSTAAFLENHPCELVGLEPSPGMLAKAIAKGLPARWIRATASVLPLRAASVDFVYASYVIHHIPDLAPLMVECLRVLRPGGCAAFVTSPIDFIRRHPMNRYFPSFADVDSARFQSEDEVRGAMAAAGFERIDSERVASDPYPIDRAYADRVANRFISTYDLLPKGEFEEGLKRLYADVEAKGRLEIDMVWESLIIWGHGPSEHGPRPHAAPGCHPKTRLGVPSAPSSSLPQ